MAKQALQGSRFNGFWMDPDDLIIVEDKAHALYDERIKLPLDESLVKNIMVYGVKHNVIVFKESDERVLVVEGRQRVRAAREANKRLDKEGGELVKVPCVVMKDTAENQVGVMISCNELRQNDGIQNKLDKLRRFMAMGRTEDDAAVVFGCTKQTINNWLALDNCVKAVLESVDAGKISATAAAKLSKLDKGEQGKALEKLLDSSDGGKKPTVKKAARIASGKASSALSKKDLTDLMSDEATPDEYRTFIAYILGEISLEKAAKASEDLEWLDRDEVATPEKE